MFGLNEFKIVALHTHPKVFDLTAKILCIEMGVFSCVISGCFPYFTLARVHRLSANWGAVASTAARQQLNQKRKEKELGSLHTAGFSTRTVQYALNLEHRRDERHLDIFVSIRYYFLNP